MLRGFVLELEGHEADIEAMLKAFWKELSRLDREAERGLDNDPIVGDLRSFLRPARSSLRGTITFLDSERFGT